MQQHFGWQPQSRCGNSGELQPGACGGEPKGSYELIADRLLSESLRHRASMQYMRSVPPRVTKSDLFCAAAPHFCKTAESRRAHRLFSAEKVGKIVYFLLDILILSSKLCKTILPNQSSPVILKTKRGAAAPPCGELCFCVLRGLFACETGREASSLAGCILFRQLRPLRLHRGNNRMIGKRRLL